MRMCNVVLSTEPRGGKGGVATVIPMYLEVLRKLGKTEFIPTHRGGTISGKVWPWICSFFRSLCVVVKNRDSRVVFHLHPGSGFCLVRMLLLTIFLRFGLNQQTFVYLHTPYLERYLNDRFWRTVISAIIGSSNRVVVLTKYALHLLEGRGLSGTARVIPNPYQVSGLKFPVERNLSRGNDITIFTMGRLIDGKGFIETLNAMSHLPENYRLVIAGDGGLRERIRELISQLDLENRVTMKGWVFGEAKDALFSSANVFCLPSRVDSFGMSFIEAQVNDVPVVAYSHPPVAEVIRPESGVLIDSTEPAMVAEAIVQANNLNASIEPGSGRKWVAAKFGEEHIYETLSEVISEII